MQRRDLVRILGAALLLPCVPRDAASALAFGRSRPRTLVAGDLEALTPPQAALVGTIAELILPRTDTPGATDAGVLPFIDHLLAHWYADDDRDHFLSGLAEIDRRAGGSFVAADAAAQAALLTALEGRKSAPGEHYEKGSAEAAFRELKSLTIYGYFTSELVVKEVTKEPVIPGRYDGCARR